MSGWTYDIRISIESNPTNKRMYFGQSGFPIDHLSLSTLMCFLCAWVIFSCYPIFPLNFIFGFACQGREIHFLGLVQTSTTWSNVVAPTTVCWTSGPRHRAYQRNSGARGKIFFGGPIFSKKCWRARVGGGAKFFPGIKKKR